MSEIKQFFAGKNVLITGATGFLGKVLLEKILRECDDINCVYLIIRRGKQRCTDYFNHLVFDNVRANQYHQLNKVKIFNGDLAKDELDLSNYELQEIYDHVHIVLHCGANVRFDLNIRDALNTNTIGLYRILEISKRIKQLQVFVFVSTAYSQLYLNVTEERHYKSQIDTFTLVKACEQFDENTMHALQAKILGDFPNTYSFSKHLAEDLVYQYRNEFPICVIRPSVITGATKDPLPYYCEGLNGFFGFGLAVSRGVLRSFYLKTDSNVLCIPVDMVANAVITTAWIHGTKKKDEIEYYNVSIIHENALTFRENSEICRKYRYQLPLNYVIWYPDGSITHCIYHHYVRVLLFQIIPAIFFDFLLRLFRQWPIMMKVQRKIFHMSNTILPYCSQICFNTDRFASIQNYQNKVDKKIFDTNIHKVNMFNIVLNGGKGLRKFICKEKDEDFPRAVVVTKVFYWIDMVTFTLMLYYVVKFMWRRYLSDLLL